VKIRDVLDVAEKLENEVSSLREENMKLKQDMDD